MPTWISSRNPVAIRWWVSLTVGFASVAVALPARAELLYFTGGRTMSVKAHHLEDGRLVLDLHTGGQIVCDPAIVERFTPDEVPYPEPALPVTPPDPEKSGSPADRVSTAYDAIIDRASVTYGVDVKLVHAIIKVESGYQERARSRRGAMGLMQLMPATARLYAVANPYDPASNIDAGTRHVRTLLDRFPLNLALAAYNAGAGAVEQFRGMPPYPETRDYVRRILAQLRQ